MLSIFDFLVFLTAIYALQYARRRGIIDFLTLSGYALIALAALIGTIRYAGYAELEGAHQLLSRMAAIIGVPAVALGFFYLARKQFKVGWIIVSIVVLFGGAAVFWETNRYGLWVGIAAQCVWLVAALGYRPRSYRLIFRVVFAVALTSIAGLVFKGSGEWLGIANQNIFHGLLALSLAYQGLAFRDISEK